MTRKHLSLALAAVAAAGSLRAVAISSAQARSAVVSSSTPGVLVAITPALEHAARSMLL